MIDNPNVAFIGGMVIGICIMFTLGLLIYVYYDLTKKFKKLFKEIKEIKSK